MTSSRKILLHGLVSLCLVAVWAPDTAASEAEHCDPGLERISSPLGYHLHEERCEGLYVEEVGSADLVVLSFTEVFEDFDAAGGRNLRVEWEAPGEEPVRLRAQGVGKRHYRMDTVRPAGTTSFLWPTDVLSGLGYTRQDMGVVGWTRATVGEVERQIYLPLRVTQGPSSAGPDGYRLVLQPGRELAEVYVSLAEVGEDGEPSRFFKDGDPLGYGFYPHRRGVEIPVSGLGPPGVYYLQVGASVKGGGVTTIELWFFHPG
jgi:hypothetical protein